MRPKYKIWDHQENKWWKPTYEAYMGNLVDLSINSSGELLMRTINNTIHEFTFPDRFEVVMYTGLKDKNDVNIHEKHIVEIEDYRENFNKVVGMVKFNNGSFYIDTGYSSHYRWIDYKVKVIGDVFNNPELLGAKS